MVIKSELLISHSDQRLHTLQITNFFMVTKFYTCCIHISLWLIFTKFTGQEKEERQEEAQA